ncbi:MAG TPA: carboxypeptidase-like regulatory domain-containing protein [Candidatus Ozemobacteraceae bacterium]
MRITGWMLILTALAFFVSGCLGAGGGGGVSAVSPQAATSNQVTGQVYFADRQLYGGIAVIAKDATGNPVSTTYTAKDGTFSFDGLADGIYSLTATTGDTETIFATGLQISRDQPTQIAETNLLTVTHAVFDRITSSSIRLQFATSAPAVSQITYGASTARTTVSATPVSTHEITVSGLTSGTYYDVTVFLQDAGGQRVVRSGLGAWTTSSPTPTNIAAWINSGEYETRSPFVTVNLRATTATQMRVGQKADLSDAALETYATTKSLTLSGTDGMKTVYAQFRDGSGNLTPIIQAPIRLTTSKEGYLGVWIDNGASIITNTSVLLTLLYPGAEKMQLAHNSDFSSSYWEKYSQYRRWVFPSGDGEKTVYARFSGTGIDSGLVFSASTILATPVETASGTASGTTPVASQTTDPDVLTDMVIWRQISASTTEEVVSGKTISLMLEGDSIQLRAAVIVRGTLTAPGGPTIVENSPIWTVSNVENGNDTYGNIDPSTGIYKTPTVRPAVSQIEIKATSQNSYTENGTTAKKSESIFITLQDFWKPRKSGMQNDAGRDIPIYCLLVDPIWKPNEYYYLFAGTNGHGVWWTRVDSTLETDAPAFTWQQTGLASTALITPLSHIVNALAINTTNHDIAAATEDGVYILGGEVRDYSKSFKIASGPTKGIAWDRHDPDYLYITKDNVSGPGIERIYKPYGGKQRTLFHLGEYYTATKQQHREEEVGSPAVKLTNDAFPNDIAYLYSGKLRTLSVSNSEPNIVFFGTEAGEFGYIYDSQEPNVSNPSVDYGTYGPLYWFEDREIFDNDTTTSAHLRDGYALQTNYNTKSGAPPSGIITNISIDSNSPWTLLVSSSSGVYRSINYGGSFVSVSNPINARGTLIDPTNMTFFFYGAEDGLYRTKDAGGTWSKISSGLGGQLTMNCFTLSEGPPGTRRRIWVGTTGGVFMGAKSLDLF